ncbi:MAG: MBL fold metallo-hydrolase [Deltaproteobacteria bacterium]|nr:MBL fold metallo-hydrolase [Deltaproteobacteria bacterium]
MTPKSSKRGRFAKVSPQVIHLGGEHTVTGSCHLLQISSLNILVDCGLAQGTDAVCPMEKWPVQPRELDYVFLTHAHIDHIGRLPELVSNEFHGEIIATHPTKALLGPMLRDAMGFSEKTDDQAARLSQVIDEQSWGFEYDRRFDLKNGVRFTLGPAGHILGSCFIRFVSDDPPWSVVFSGDLGAKNTPILPDPSIPEPCDLLILESTYGDRLHEERKDRVRRLGKVLTSAMSDGGKVFIPAFALGRIQELIYEIDRLLSDRDFQQQFPALNSQSAIRNPKSGLPVFVDSPLGLEITEIYSSLAKYWDKEANDLLYHGDHPIDFDHLYAVKNYHDHLKLLELPGPYIVLAGSGMCSGGRIVEHLKAGLEDPANDVCFVAYQAPGTPGRDIIRYGKRPGGYVCLNGERVTIKAKIHVLPGYSAHADQNGLIEWVESMPEKPKAIKLVHGEPQAQSALGSILKEKGYHMLMN